MHESPLYSPEGTLCYGVTHSTTIAPLNFENELPETVNSKRRKVSKHAWEFIGG
jgi:hypothetical protein